MSIRRNDQGLTVRSRRSRLGGLLGVTIGPFLISLGILTFPFDIPFLIIMGAASWLVGMRLLAQKLDIRPGTVRIHSLTGPRDYSAAQIRVNRISWMGAIQIYDLQGSQIFWMRTSPAEADRICSLLESVAGAKVD